MYPERRPFGRSELFSALERLLAALLANGVCISEGCDDARV